IIVGGGLAGGLCALALARAGLSVAVVDAEPVPRMRELAFDGRTSALAYACVRVFKRLGLWDAIEPHAEPILDILVSDGRARARFSNGARSPLHLHFDSRELEGGEPLGWIVENVVLRAAIFEAIAKTPEINLFAPARVERADFEAEAAHVELSTGQRLSAPLIVAADGRNSALRRQAGVKTTGWQYGQTGIVVTVKHERPHKGVAHEFFLPSGPFAILPLKDNRSSLVWTERSDAAPAYLALDDDAFTRAIADRFGDFLGAVELASPRWSYPLALHLAQRFIAPRLALIGDAAHAVHPIAGQGFNLGVKDVAALADVLEEAAGVGLDLGSMSVLENYERWRRFESISLSLGMDAINRLFSNDFAPLRLARDIGMNAVGKAAPLRRFFMRQAGADIGRLPPLMQAER
ncbi:MAG: UbiH/UbiF/VisC/COQ6 family ubiquinone biosynthesis hydroxylase, partial [Amphiplicatus sp.]|nr:UbiH/UbiF/VisC/COQ6 family ubiquinone biosynthesis hydroxylase [Amphiplicatus sp.]